jgi:ATP-dependent Clp protease adaptor protein ClpS
VIEDVESVTETRLGQPWNVIVHDDPISLMTYVTMVFQRVFGYSLAKAEKLMLDVHHTGRALVWSGAREQAELYVFKLHANLLLATLERTDG